jgi:hypothetical protein
VLHPMLSVLPPLVIVLSPVIILLPLLVCVLPSAVVRVFHKGFNVLFSMVNEPSAVVTVLFFLSGQCVSCTALLLHFLNGHYASSSG